MEAPSRVERLRSLMFAYNWFSQNKTTAVVSLGKRGFTVSERNYHLIPLSVTDNDPQRAITRFEHLVEVEERYAAGR